MTIKDVFQNVKSRLGAYARVPYHDFGQQHIAETAPDDSPRIIWVPTGGTINGGRQSIRPDSDGNPIPLFQRNVAVEAWIWAGSTGDTEVLMNHFVAALHATMAGAWSPTGEKWAMWSPNRDTPPNTDDWVMGSRQATDVRILCVLSFTLRLTLTAEPYGEVDNVTEVLTANMEQPS